MNLKQGRRLHAEFKEQPDQTAVASYAQVGTLQLQNVAMEKVWDLQVLQKYFIKQWSSPIFLSATTISTNKIPNFVH